MSSLITYTMVKRGEYSEWVQKLYLKFGRKPFTYKQALKKIPHFKPSLLNAMRNSHVIKLLDGRIRAIGRSKKNPSVWVFTAEALFLLEQK
jgi:hypothetical protein